MTHYPVTQNGKPDLRYRISPVWRGHEKPRHTLYFCDQYIADSSSMASMITRAIGHNAARTGATIFEAVETQS